jgi:hypothetical protein
MLCATSPKAGRATDFEQAGTEIAVRRQLHENGRPCGLSVVAIEPDLKLSRRVNECRIRWPALSA